MDQFLVKNENYNLFFFFFNSNFLYKKSYEKDGGGK